MDPPEALHPPAPAPPPTRAHPRRSPCIPRRGPPFRGGPTMPAVVQVNEYNGAGSTKTPNVPRGDWLSADLPGDVDRRNTNYLQKPTSGLTRSFEKWQKLELTNLSGSVKLALFRHYLAPPLPTVFAASTAAVTPATSPTYAQPTASDSVVATHAMPTSDPGNAQISGTLLAPGETGFVVTQLDVDTTAAAGFSTTINFKYAEIS